VAAAIAVVIAVLCSSVAAADTTPSCLVMTPCPPANDNYLSSLELNRPGTKLDRVHTLQDVRTTTDATVQSNLLDPCGRATCPPGPAEHTTCSGISYGNTVWYDFYPDSDGTVRIRTSGANVIALYTWSVNTLLPSRLPQRCLVNPGFPSVELDAQVKKGRAYTFQVGDATGATGQLQMLFDYFVPPKRLTADSNITSSDSPNGSQLLDLSVTTNRAAKVRVTCGRFCRPLTKSGRAVEDFRELNGIHMPVGSKIKIYVTAPNAVGAYIEWDVVSSNIVKHILCLEPGSTKPRHKCL
jgi:hypothetical protein